MQFASKTLLCHHIQTISSVLKIQKPITSYVYNIAIWISSGGQMIQQKYTTKTTV